MRGILINFTQLQSYVFGLAEMLRYVFHITWHPRYKMSVLVTYTQKLKTMQLGYMQALHVHILQ